MIYLTKSTCERTQVLINFFASFASKSGNFFSGCFPNMLFIGKSSFFRECAGEMVSRSFSSLSKCANHISWNEIGPEGR